MCIRDRSICTRDIDFTDGVVRVESSGDIGSMRIWIRGAVTADNLENSIPYESRPFNLVVGDYEVTTRIFSEREGRGDVCEERTFRFSIVACGNMDICDQAIDGGQISVGACNNGVIIIGNAVAPTVPNGQQFEVVWILSLIHI